MFPNPGQRGFMPPALMNNQYAASFPVNSALPSNPNPLSRTQPVNATKADANGIQQAMAKRAAEKVARNMGLGNVPTGTGPQQMFSALSMLNQAKALVDPAETLKKHRLARGDFEGMIDELAADGGDTYDFDSYRKDPKSEATSSGLAGALLGGLGGAGAGALGGGGLGAILGGLGGAAAGGLGGVGLGNYRAGQHNKKLLGTAKVLREYGLLQPEYLRAAMPLLKESSSCNMHPTAAGEGDKKYKIDPAADAKGEDAFKSLDEYMKKAGLNSFQANFFGRLIQAGLDETQIRQATKIAGDRFGEKVAAELNSGIEKIAFLQAAGQLAGRALPFLGRAGRAIGGYFAPAAKAVKTVAPVADDALKAVAPVADDAAKAAPSMLSRAWNNPVTGHAMTGAATGALNPQTGLMSEDPSITGTLGGAAAGGLLGGLGGRYLPTNVANIGQDIQRRAMAGAGTGYGLGYLTGGQEQGAQFARYGQLAGLLPGSKHTLNIPKIGPMNSNQLVGALDPMNLATKAVTAGGRGAYNLAKADPLKAIGAGGLALGGYGVSQIPGAINRQGEAARVQLEQAKNQLQDQVHGYAQDFYNQATGMRQDINNSLAPVSQAAQKAQGLLGGFGDLNSMLGNAGQFFQNNQHWLMPLLMSGLGAGGGYMLGGGGGAAMGGIGLPLAYMLMQNPQMLSGLMGNSPQASVAQQQAAQQQAREDATVKQQIQDPVAEAAKMTPQNEIQRQQEQQQAEMAAAGR